MHFRQYEKIIVMRILVLTFTNPHCLLVLETGMKLINTKMLSNLTLLVSQKTSFTFTTSTNTRVNFCSGAMALNFVGVERYDIKNMGRWNSDTCLIFIYNQISEYSEGWPRK